MSATVEDIYGGRYVVYRGETRPIPFTAQTPGSVAGQTFEVRVSDPLGNMTPFVIANGSLTIVTGTGAITATLTTTMTTTTISARLAEAWLWRTDAGHENALAWIELEMVG